METGTLNHEGIAGAGAAVDWLASLAEGRDRRTRLERSMHELARRADRLVTRLWDGLGTVEAVTSVATDTVENVNDVPSGGVSINEMSPTEDDLITAVITLADEDGLGPIGYQWLRDGVEIPEATGESYTLTQADVGKTISVTASYTDGQGTVESATSSATAAVQNRNDAPTGSVTSRVASLGSSCSTAITAARRPTGWNRPAGTVPRSEPAAIDRPRKD